MKHFGKSLAALGAAALSFVMLPQDAEAQRGRPGGGTPVIEFFEGPNFTGRSVRIDGEAPDFRRINFNDMPGSFRIERSYWELCFDINYRSRCQIFWEDAPQLTGGWNRQISSARPIEFRRGGREALMMFSEPNFGGEARMIIANTDNFNSIQFNDRARSLRVLGGDWIVCEHANFAGRCETLDNEVSDLRRLGLDRTISSASPTSQYNPPAPSNPGYGPGPGYNPNPGYYDGTGNHLRPGSVFGGTRGAQSTYYASPRVSGAPVARCMSSFDQRACDQVTADALCRAEGFRGAAFFAITEQGRGNHYFIGDGRTGFSSGALSDVLCIR
ncbi:MAG: beta/gamma crystallin-related protein [Caulobacterales bacterium]|uniref:beta/gamma crystallin-related protein n=1 Tax=Glycocaulis sp. TaxID=1969725 RepID=UPI003FA088E6